VHGASVLSVAPLLPLMWWMSCGGVAALLSTPAIAFGLLCKVAPSTAFGGWCARPGRRGACGVRGALLGRGHVAAWRSRARAGRCGLVCRRGTSAKASSMLRPLLRTRQGPACVGARPMHSLTGGDRGAWEAWHAHAWHSS